MFPLAENANVLIFACLPGTIAAVEISAYEGIMSSVVRLLRWFAAVSKGRLMAVFRVKCLDLQYGQGKWLGLSGLAFMTSNQ